jgi:hypothetical protein
MDIISAYREAGTYRGAAAISGTTPKTVRRVIARHEAGGGAPARVPRGHNYDVVTTLVAERVAKTSARISAADLRHTAGHAQKQVICVPGPSPHMQGSTAHIRRSVIGGGCEWSRYVIACGSAEWPWLAAW